MRFTQDKHLHSREHLLADDLMRVMGEPRKFAAYLGVAKMYHEADLRSLAKRVLAKPDLELRNRGRYFFAALKGLEKKYIWLKPRGARGKKKLKSQAPKESFRLSTGQVGKDNRKNGAKINSHRT